MKTTGKKGNVAGEYKDEQENDQVRRKQKLKILKLYAGKYKLTYIGLKNFSCYIKLKMKRNGEEM